MRTFKNGQARHLGCADDHAFVAHGLVELFEATQNMEWLDRAVELADQMIERFWDEGEKAFYFTGHDAEKLIARTRSFVGAPVTQRHGGVGIRSSRVHSGSVGAPREGPSHPVGILSLGVEGAQSPRHGGDCGGSGSRAAGTSSSWWVPPWTERRSFARR
jgi:hypothetical protein